LAFAGDFEQGMEALEKSEVDLAIACFNTYIRPTSTGEASVNWDTEGSRTYRPE
jgi:hypothetical protein